MKTLLSQTGLLVLSLGALFLQAQTPVNPQPPSQTAPPAKPPAPATRTTPESKQGIPDAETAMPAQTPMSADLDRTQANQLSKTIIGPEDVLLIRVWQEPNLSGQVTVGPDGMISLQLIDEVKADGLTPAQLKSALTERLKAFIVNPDVNVQVLRVNSRKFIIQGEVNRPGSFPLIGPTTVMEALVYGGGFREFANSKKIYILRTEIDPKTKKRETKRFKFNYKEVSNGKNMDQDILIKNGDQIFVP